MIVYFAHSEAIVALNLLASVSPVSDKINGSIDEFAVHLLFKLTVMSGRINHSLMVLNLSVVEMSHSLVRRTYAAAVCVLRTRNLCARGHPNAENQYGARFWRACLNQSLFRLVFCRPYLMIPKVTYGV